MRLFPGSVLVAALLLAGCASQPEETARVTEPDSTRPAVDIELASYGAVDYLIETARAPLSADKPVVVTTLVDNANLAQSSPLGRLISEQLATRLAMAGYTVRELRFGNTLRVREGTGELVLSRDLRNISRTVGAQAIVVGTYTPASSRVFVNAKLIHAVSGDLLSAVDFELPMSDDVKSLVPPVAAHEQATTWERYCYAPR